MRTKVLLRLKMTRFLTTKMVSLTMEAKRRGRPHHVSNDVCSRLIQNRKSAMKCRLKKKAEFEQLKEDFAKMREDKLILNQQVLTIEY